MKLLYDGTGPEGNLNPTVEYISYFHPLTLW
jgi:hypothetical protein